MSFDFLLSFTYHNVEGYISYLYIKISSRFHVPVAIVRHKTVTKFEMRWVPMPDRKPAMIITAFVSFPLSIRAEPLP